MISFTWNYWNSKEVASLSDESSWMSPRWKHRNVLLRCPGPIPCVYSAASCRLLSLYSRTRLKRVWGSRSIDRFGTQFNTVIATERSESRPVQSWRATARTARDHCSWLETDRLTVFACNFLKPRHCRKWQSREKRNEHSSKPWFIFYDLSYLYSSIKAMYNVIFCVMNVIKKM